MTPSSRRSYPVLKLALLGALVSLVGCRDTKDGVPNGRNSSGRESRTASRPAHHVEQWHLDPRDSSAIIAAQSSEAELRERFGEGAIRPTRIELGEGETAAGTLLFPTDSFRRAEIIWQDTLARRRPARIILRGNQSRWQVGPGISLNTSLRQLEQLNGRPFTLAGFGWDYGGVVTSWNGGALDSSLAGVKLYLDPGPAQYESAPYSQVLGDRDYSSDLPAMHQLSPRVWTIFIDFESR
jgi:hypothetical protein